MIARVGISDTGRDVEIAVENRDDFIARVDAAYAENIQILWLTDTKGNDVGVPIAKIAYIELAGDPGPSVGFSR